MKTFRNILLLFCLVFAILFFLAIEVVPPDSRTMTTLRVLEFRIKLYYERYGELPVSLDSLPVLLNGDETIVDSQGKPIRFEVKGNCIRLQSTGKPSLFHEFTVEDTKMITSE